MVKLFWYLSLRKIDIPGEILVKHYARTVFNMYNLEETKIKCMLKGEDFFTDYFVDQLKYLSNMVLLAHTGKYFIPSNYQKGNLDTIEDFKERLCRVVSEDLLLDLRIGQPIFQFNAYSSNIDCPLEHSFYMSVAKFAKYLKDIIP